MAAEGLPPSPNWYCSAASDTNKEGVLAYASRNSVVLLNITEEKHSLLGYLHGHEQRVAVVSFNTVECQLLSTCGDDSRVIVWNWRSKSIIKQHEHHEGKVTCVAWSPLDRDVLVTGDDRGMVISWNLGDEQITQWTPERDQIACIAHANNGCHHLAIGYKSGQILVLDLKQRREAVISRLRGHDNEVHSMCWSPSPWQQPQSDSTPGETDHALLSGGKDQTIRLWSPGNEDMLQVLKLPVRGGPKSRHRGDDSASRGRVWVSLWWPSDRPTQFLSSSYSGCIVLWDLSKQKPKWTILGQDSPVQAHSRPVFSILPVMEDFFITSSMDRQIVLWSLESYTPSWGVSTLGGFIYQLTISSLDSSTIAMGVGDNMVRVWNPSTRGASCVSLWQGLRSKITAICWHPEREGLLAFGTDDGKVGVFTAVNPGKAPVLSRTFHKKTVYSLSWGPQCCKTSEYQPADEGLVCLYSCGGEGMVYQHHATSLQEEAVGIDSIIRDTNSLQHMLPLRSEVSWRSDRSVVALGNCDGSIEVCSAPHLLLLCTIQVHHKIINCLQWFPHLSSQGQRSQLQFCLASGSNESVVYVHDLSSVLDKEELAPLTAPISSAFRVLNGHMLRVTALDWSPLADGRLVSVSYDGTAQVWDVNSGEPVANFRGHHGRLLSVAWSRLDPDVIFSGGEDFCLMKWRISECTHHRPPKDKKELNVKFYNTVSSNKDKKGKRRNNKGTGSFVFTKAMVAPPTPTNVDPPPANNGQPLPPTAASAPPLTNGVAESTEGTKPAPLTAPVKIQERDLMSITELLEKKRRELLGQGDGEDGAGVGDEGSSVAPEVIGGDQATVLGQGTVRELGGRTGGGEPVGDPGEAETARESQRGTNRSRRKKGKSYFPVSSQLDNRGKQYYLQDCRSIAERRYGADRKNLPSLDGDSVHLGLFTSRRDLMQTVSAEGVHHTEHGNYDNKAGLDVWQGRTLQTIRQAAHEGQLNDRLVAVAPLAGYDAWLETCRTYAQQLEASGDPQKAATYYVCCHQVYDALRVLRESKHFREAISLAMARLRTTDPALQEIYQCWASQLEAENSFEQAARCYLALDEPENAVRLLARSGSQSSLRTALEVAILTNQRDMLTSLVPRYANECMLNADWSEPWQISSDDASIMALHLVTLVHEAVCLASCSFGMELSDHFDDPKHSLDVPKLSIQDVDEFSGCPLVVLDEVPLLRAALDAWTKREGDPWGRISKADLLNRITELFVPSFDSQVKKQFLISVAICIAMDYLKSGGGESCSPHTEKVLHHCYQESEFDLIQTVLSLTHPKGFFQDSLSTATSELIEGNCTDYSLVQSYYAYIALNHQWWNMPGGSNSDGGLSPTERTLCKDRMTNGDDTICKGELSGETAVSGCNDDTTLQECASTNSDLNKSSVVSGISQNGVGNPKSNSNLEAIDSKSGAVCEKDSAQSNSTLVKPGELSRASQNVGVDEGSTVQKPTLGHTLITEDIKTVRPMTSENTGGVSDAWQTALKRTEVCKAILVGRSPLPWYKLKAELEEILRAKVSLLSSSRKATDGMDHSILTSQQRGVQGNGASAATGSGEINQGETTIPYLCDGDTTVQPSHVPTDQNVDGTLKSQSRGLIENGGPKDSGSGCEAAGKGEVDAVMGVGDSMPIFERYRHDSVTMEMLQTHEERVRDELASCGSECQRPDPVEAALVISSILTNALLSGQGTTATSTKLEELLEWGAQNCFTKEQLKHFSRLSNKVGTTGGV